MRGLLDKLRGYELSETEVKRLQEEGILDPAIENLFDEKTVYTQYKETHVGYVRCKLAKKSQGQWRIYTDTLKKAVDLGVRLFFMNNDSDSATIFLLVTQFYLIIYEQEILPINDRYGNTVMIDGETKCFNKPTVDYIPLNIIDSFTISVPRYSSSASSYSYEVGKSPVKGAIVGGVLGGAPGAVIGAHVNSGTTTKTRYYSSKTDTYDGVIKIKGEEYKISSLIVVDANQGSELYISGNCAVNRRILQYKNSDEPVYTDNIVESCKKRLNYLLTRSKRIISFDERKKIIINERNTYSPQTQEYVENTKKNNKISEVTITIIFIVIVMGCCWLMSQC